MAAVSLTVVDVLHNADGTKDVVLGDSNTLSGLTVNQLNTLADPAEDGPLVRKLMAWHWKSRSATFASATSVVGRTFQIDMSLDLGQLQVGEV